MHLPGQREFHPQLAAVIGLGNLLKDGLVVHLGGDLQGNAGSRFAVGPFEKQFRGHVVAGAIAVAGELRLGLKMRRRPADHFKGQALLGKNVVQTSGHQRVDAGGQRIAAAGTSRCRRRDR